MKTAQYLEFENNMENNIFTVMCFDFSYTYIFFDLD